MNKYILAILTCLTMINCRDFLAEKTDLKLATPETVEDNQALLDQERFNNQFFPSSGETSSDDIYLTDQEYAGLPFTQLQRLYTWQPDNVGVPISETNNDWFTTYRGIYLANIVLHNIKIYDLKGSDADNLKGQALALRALRYLTGAQIWCLAYDRNKSKTDLGMALRLDPDMSYPSVRASVEETYQQILKDFHDASELLPNRPLAYTRMSKPAVLGLLARTYLYMGEYENSLKYSLQSLELENKLMNYNTINASSNYPISNTNLEIIFRGLFTERHLRTPKVPLSLYNKYLQNDLRKSVFFRVEQTGEITFKGHYLNSLGGLAGIATDEVYLTAAESYARLNKVSNAMDMLNSLLVTRWKAGTFIPLQAGNMQAALDKIFDERRKELMMRGLRWSDIKRLNRDGAAISLSRTVNGQSYSLPPNDLRYAIAIPEEIIGLSGMKQNPR